MAVVQLQGINMRPGLLMSGIGSQGVLLFANGFEEGNLSVWDDITDAGNHMSVITSQAQEGTHAFQAFIPANQGVGSLSKFFLPGVDHAKATFWFKLATGWTGGMKLFILRGSRTDNQWSSFGVGGLCPDGTDFFLANIIIEANGKLTWYTYYVDMIPFEGGLCFGDVSPLASPQPIYYEANRVPSVNVWHKIDFELCLNTVGLNDGWQKCWLDDALAMEWYGLEFRTSSILKINDVTLELSEQGSVGSDRTIWMDNVSVYEWH